MKTEHYLLLGGVLVLAILLYVNRGCSSCAAKYSGITGQSGAWPGAGPGVAQTPGYTN